MEAEVVNLRLARKRRARAAAANQADENRRLHGRPGAERNLTAFERKRAEAEFAGHRREQPQDKTASTGRPDDCGNSS